MNIPRISISTSSDILILGRVLLIHVRGHNTVHRAVYRPGSYHNAQAAVWSIESSCVLARCGWCMRPGLSGECCWHRAILNGECLIFTDLGAAASTVIETMDLAAVSQQHPMALSDGQQQRLAIATALASGRDTIVLDEPTSGLDLGHMRSVADALSILTSQRKTVIVITHDPDLVNACADYVIRMEHGQIVDS